ncbi:MAG: hypothetical protein RLZZ293_936 [Pseudomonadota bacterium]
MLKSQFIDQLAQQMAGFAKINPLHDLEHNFKAILQASLSKLDLVSREEFDIQQKILLDTRHKLDELTQMVNDF